MYGRRPKVVCTSGRNILAKSVFQRPRWAQGARFSLKMTGNGPRQPRQQAAEPPVSTRQVAIEGGLLARQLCRRLMENARTGYLRSDQEGRNHGRHADKSQELING